METVINVAISAMLRPIKMYIYNSRIISYRAKLRDKGKGKKRLKSSELDSRPHHLV